MHISSHSIGYWKTNALAAVNLEAMRRRIGQSVNLLVSTTGAGYIQAYGTWHLKTFIEIIYWAMSQLGSASMILRRSLLTALQPNSGMKSRVSDSEGKSLYP